MIDQGSKIVLTGAAGLVGQNLAVLLRELGSTRGVFKLFLLGCLRKLFMQFCCRV
jgi:nucleoside-diphosphate-sugar epimerase